MIAKYWKKIGLIILIIACLFNITSKVIHHTTLGNELKSSATYFAQQENKDQNE